MTVQDKLRFTLESISFSHYNEKVRWTMDYYGLAYTEFRSLPILHIISMFNKRAKEIPAGGGTKFVTPFLSVEPETDNHKENKPSPKDLTTFNDSTAIMEFLSDRYAEPANSNKTPGQEGTLPAHLYSNDAATRTKILSLEDRFDTIIGPHVRRYMYSELLLHCPKSVGQSLGQHDNAGSLQMWIWTFFFPIFSWILIRFIRVNEKSAERSKEILKREFEHLSRVLESGPPGPAYLVGNQFTAADLTLASLAGMVVGVTQEDGYGAWVPSMDVLRPEARKFCEEMRATTAGQHILECYKLHKGKKAEGTGYGFKFFGKW